MVCEADDVRVREFKSMWNIPAMHGTIGGLENKDYGTDLSGPSFCRCQPNVGTDYGTDL